MHFSFRWLSIFQLYAGFLFRDIDIILMIALIYSCQGVFFTPSTLNSTSLHHALIFIFASYYICILWLFPAALHHYAGRQQPSRCSRHSPELILLKWLSLADAHLSSPPHFSFQILMMIADCRFPRSAASLLAARFPSCSLAHIERLIGEKLASLLDGLY